MFTQKLVVGCRACAINMETDNCRYISGGLGKAESFTESETKCDHFSKTNSEHMAKLFRGERVGRNTDQKENQFSHADLVHYTSFKST